MKTSLSPEVKRLILDKVSSGRYRSADEVVRRGLILLQKDEDETRTASSADKSDLPAIFTDIAASVPDADWRKVPVNLSKNLDHYLYDAQKTS